MAYDVGATGVMTDYPGRLRSFLDRNSNAGIHRPKGQLNGLLADSPKFSKRIERQLNDTILNRFTVLGSKRPVCRATTTVVHSGTDICKTAD